MHRLKGMVASPTLLAKPIVRSKGPRLETSAMAAFSSLDLTGQGFSLCHRSHRKQQERSYTSRAQATNAGQHRRKMGKPAAGAGAVVSGARLLTAAGLGLLAGVAVHTLIQLARRRKRSKPWQLAAAAIVPAQAYHPSLSSSGPAIAQQ